jgi:hypothetical protein
LGGALQLKADAMVGKGKTDEARQFRNRHHKLLGSWPDTSRSPEATETSWVAEANLCIRALTLGNVGGFLEKRAHDVQPIGLELAKRHLDVTFDPEITVQHIGHGEGIPPAAMLASSVHLAKKYGLRQFMLGR